MSNDYLNVSCAKSIGQVAERLSGMEIPSEFEEWVEQANDAIASALGWLEGIEEELLWLEDIEEELRNREIQAEDEAEQQRLTVKGDSGV